MVEASKYKNNEASINSTLLKEMQCRYILVGLLVSPLFPFLYIQGKYTRWKVGRLPDAKGNAFGVFSGDRETIKLFAIGESTVAGIGARTHAEALTGQFAKHLNVKTGKTVDWEALGKSGITVERTIEEIVPKIPDEEFDLILIALGGNDIFNAKSPQSFRENMFKLLGILRDKNPKAKIFLANVPMVRDFVALPNPLKYILSRLAKLYHLTAIDLVSKMSGTFYFEDVKKVEDDFFSDGVHPSERGYDLWTEAMVNFLLRKMEDERTS